MMYTKIWINNRSPHFIFFFHSLFCFWKVIPYLFIYGHSPLYSPHTKYLDPTQAHHLHPLLTASIGRSGGRSFWNIGIWDI
uniref:Uncharacterized protein n=1 Tax=Picea glauca TaxID=3330 RepID=A0A101LTY6_PICGL|nr:hypothetical protein ABT39_MTgene3472 [Picea glauca]QHR91360.1 hypothetical protein Q903MT_gene5394 [Picea sitchensis]